VLDDYNEKVKKEDIFKPITGNKSLHESSNDNRVTVVTSVTTKICQECNVPTLQHS